MVRFIAFTALLLGYHSVFADEALWQQTIKRYSASIVSIEIDIPVSFDTSPALNSEATGFVVDAAHGIILTNRHVVQPGPVVARAIFHNQQELPLTAIYRDPVHDFGFFQYDAKALRGAPPADIALRPELASVGMPIRVIGNDSGERFSIADSTLARLDRNVPNYGNHGYNDFNTFYLQAASGASGGSSGSPVLNSAGQAIALQAAGFFLSNTNLFLPLDRIRYALTRLQAGLDVPRGTLETTFVHRSDDELIRLGVSRKQLATLHTGNPALHGALVVDRVQPGGPAAGKLRAGDTLLALDGKAVTEFTTLEGILDAGVGRKVTLRLSRNGKTRPFTLRVADLHAISPNQYLTISNAVLHPIGYQQARHLDLPVEGVVLAAPGYMFGNAGVPKGSVIREINAQPIPDLDTAQRLLQGIPDRVDFTLRYTPPTAPRRVLAGVVTNDRRWFPTQRCTRDSHSRWHCGDLPDPPAAGAQPALVFRLPRQDTPVASAIQASLARISFYAPYSVDGVPGNASSATGLVVDAQAGLVVSDRSNVPNVIGDAYITFGGSARIPAQVVYLHPLHNLVLLHYDPARLADSPLRSARLSTTELRPGDEIQAVGLVQNGRIRQQRRKVLEYFPLPETSWEHASFQDRDLMILATAQSYYLDSGVFVNNRGEVAAMITSFRYDQRDSTRHAWAIPIAYVRDLMQQVKGRKTTPRALGIDLQLAGFDYVRRMGVTSQQLESIGKADASRNEALMVSQIFRGSPVRGVLRSGDVLLAVGGEPLNSFRALENAVQRPHVALMFSRNGTLHTTRVAPWSLDSLGTHQLVFWAGANLQDLNRKLQSVIEPGSAGVYVNATAPGSPARRAGLAGEIIIRLDGEPVQSLEDFSARVRNPHPGHGYRLRLRDLDGVESVTTLQLPPRHWALSRVDEDHGVWKRRFFAD